MTQQLWSKDDGLLDVTSAFQGFTQPLSEIVDDIHRRGWTVGKISVKDGEYVAEGKSPHGEKLEATGRTDATAAANLLVKVMRREHMRAASIREKLGAWDHHSIEQQFTVIAQAYAGAPVYEPKAAPAWMDLAQDCQRRAQVIRMQITVELTNDPTPYESADDMREDVGKKRHILITRAYAHHPVWSEAQMLDYRLVVDVLGHMVGGADWGWHGTCLAFASLAPLLAESPQKALFTELLGQTAFGQFYRQWGPQKICFLEELIAKEQGKENGAGHHGVHPSQSIVPTQLPRIGPSGGTFSRVAAETVKRRLQRALKLENEHGPDQSQTVHHFPDGWTIRELQTYADMDREGQLMNNCFSPWTQSGQDMPHRHWEGHPEAQPEEPGSGFGEIQNYQLPIPTPLYSLRDPTNLPHASYDPLASSDYYDAAALGRNNSTLKPEYERRFNEWWDTDPHTSAMVGVPKDPNEGSKIAMALGPEHPEYDPYYDEMAAGWHRRQIPLYHTAPSALRDQIQREGLRAADPGAPQESGVYVEGDPTMSQQYWGDRNGIADRDIWQIDQRHVKKLMPDYEGQAAYIPHDVPPEALTLHTGAQASGTAQLDPNADWESGITPLQDNAYLWQRANGVDPLNVQSTMDALHPLETGIATMHPEMLKQAVSNALRMSLLGTRNNPKGHAIHYQDLMGVPADVDDPMAYWDALEQQRENWNQARGYAPGSHKQHWPEEQQFKQWVKATNPQLDDGEVQRLAKRELLHMLTEEEERLLAQDQGEQLPAEHIEHEAYEALRRRLKGLTKPKVDQKVDFGDQYLYHEAATEPHIVFRENLDPTNTLGNAQGYWGRWPTVYDEASHTVHVGPEGSMHSQVMNEMPDPHAALLQRWQGWVGSNPEEYSGLDPSERQIGSTNIGWYNGSPGAHIDYALATRNWPRHPDSDAEDPGGYGHAPHLATHHADMYPPYLSSRLRPLALIGQNASTLADAAREDLLGHGGRGHQFRSAVLSLGIPGIGPRQASAAWLHLAPQTSQLGIVDPHIAETLGHNYPELSNRDYFKAERELAAGRDASGYNHVPLGAFSTALWDLKGGGPGWHPDRTPFKAVSPSPHHSIDWNAQVPQLGEWTDPYWWSSTQEARDQVGKDFDRTVATEHGRDEIPFQKTAAAAFSTQLPLPWVINPLTGERNTGAPGTSLMQHLKDTFGHPSVQEVWNQDYELGKDTSAPQST